MSRRCVICGETLGGAHPRRKACPAHYCQEAMAFARYRADYLRHRERRCEKQKLYREADPENYLAKQRARYRRDREKRRVEHKRYYEANRERCLAKSREYYTRRMIDAEWREKEAARSRQRGLAAREALAMVRRMKTELTNDHA